MSSPVIELRRLIQENTRIQKGLAIEIDYVDVSHALADALTRQNHVIFGRRGCGKSLLLDKVRKGVKPDVRAIYVNCEDYKHHTFPNVLIEILDAIFSEIENHLGGWFGKKKKLRELVLELRHQLEHLRKAQDERASKVVARAENETKASGSVGAASPHVKAELGLSSLKKQSIEEEYQVFDDKIRDLNQMLPQLKRIIEQFFVLSQKVKVIYIQLDDFYQLRRPIQPYVADYLHRLCKDVPLFFKIGTLRHASSLFADRDHQPIGAQERHDYQPINVDYTLADFKKTSSQLSKILGEYTSKAGMTKTETEYLFKGEGFDRLVLASGGVPRDFLSLLLEALAVKPVGDERIGKDDVRVLSLSTFQRRIEELKADSEEKDHDILIRGIYAIRKFCLDKQTNVFLVSDKTLQEKGPIKDLLNRLIDYRIIHLVGTALTHKSQSGTFTAYMIDIGAYANLRKLHNRFREVDVTATDAKERCRNAPILEGATLENFFNSAPESAEQALLNEVVSDDDEDSEESVLAE
jgi:hypothetical protein